MTIKVGKWLGESGGGLEILEINGFDIKGRYCSKHGNVPSDAWYDIAGFTDGKLIGFSVLWKNEKASTNSITSWTGRFFKAGNEDGYGDSSKDRLELNWHLHRLDKDGDSGPEETYMWESNYSNYSILYRVD